MPSEFLYYRVGYFTLEFFFFSSRRRHTRCSRDWSSDVCSSDLIDTSPDFRQQAMRAGLERLDAILLTHGHADHVLGFDDIRPYNIRQRASLPVYSKDRKSVV